MNQPEISIIVLNWNGKKYLKVCLDSLRKQNFKNFEVILIDNGSEDESIEFVKNNYPEIKIIALQENMGFSKAVNIGIKEARGDYIALLNNDTEIHPDWLKNLRLALAGNQKISFCASKMLSFNERDVIDSAGDRYSISKDRCLIYRIGRDQKDGPRFNQSKEVFSARGGAAIYRKELFNEIGLFDEDFFISYEDVDLSFRAQLAGLKCLYVPSAIVYHIGRVTVNKINYFSEYFGCRNRIYLLIKNMPVWFLIKYFRQTVWFEFWWAVKDLIKMLTGYKLNENIKVRLKSRYAVLKNFWKMYKKRRFIQKNRRVSLKYLESILT